MEEDNKPDSGIVAFGFRRFFEERTMSFSFVGTPTERPYTCRIEIKGKPTKDLLEYMEINGKKIWEKEANLDLYEEIIKKMVDVRGEESIKFRDWQAKGDEKNA